MLVEFTGGSLHGQQKTIEQFYRYINTDRETYWAKIIAYKSLGWVYIWYETEGEILV